MYDIDHKFSCCRGFSYTDPTAERRCHTELDHDVSIRFRRLLDSMHIYISDKSDLKFSSSKGQVGILP